MRSQIVTILTLLLSFLSSNAMLAQSKSTTPPEPQRMPPPLPEAPIDNGILLLLVAGLLYGSYIAYKRFLNSRKEA